MCSPVRSWRTMTVRMSSCGGRLDQRVDRIGEEDVDSLGLHGPGDGGGDVHRLGPLFMG